MFASCFPKQEQPPSSQLHGAAHRAGEACVVYPERGAWFGNSLDLAATGQAQIAVEVRAGRAAQAEERKGGVPHAPATGMNKSWLLAGSQEEADEAAMWKRIKERQAYWDAKAAEQAAAKKLADQQAAERRREAVRWAEELRQAAAQVAKMECEAAALHAARATQPVTLERKKQ
ncbi:hypothetical protein ACK3TF_003020 [Chlorella vulgaris]